MKASEEKRSSFLLPTGTVLRNEDLCREVLN